MLGWKLIKGFFFDFFFGLEIKFKIILYILNLNSIVWVCYKCNGK